jgi:hypothetical protein
MIYFGDRCRGGVTLLHLERVSARAITIKRKRDRSFHVDRREYTKVSSPS